VANFNRVLSLARGEFFMWAASDDVWHPRFVESLCGLLRASPGAVLAFCSFNNIDEKGRGIREYPDLAGLMADDQGTRLSRFLAQPEHLGKANLIYGMTRRQALVDAGGFTLWSERDWGVDMLAVFRLLSMGQLVLTHELLFHKRLLSAAPSPVRIPEALSSGLGRWREDLLDRQAYFFGYRKLISMTEGLSPEQRETLCGIARARARQVRREAWRGLRHTANRKLMVTLRRMAFLDRAL
jgi:hypothetical protein